MRGPAGFQHGADLLRGNFKLRYTMLKEILKTEFLKWCYLMFLYMVVATFAENVAILTIL